MKLVHIATQKEIDVPFAHAINVLIPQGKYEAVDASIEAGVKPAEEDDSLKGQSVNEEITRAGLMKMLDDREVKYRPTELKADLLALVEKAYNIKVNNVNIPRSSK